MSNKIKRILAALLMLAVLMGGSSPAVFAEDVAPAQESAQQAAEEAEATPTPEPTLAAGQMARMPEPMGTATATATPTPNPSASPSVSPSASAAPECAHEWSDWADYSDMNCITGGTQIRVCELCEQIQTQIVSGSHKYTILVDMVNEPNCKTGKPGIAEMKCSRCTSTQLMSVPATHDYSVLVNTIKEASCSAEGKALMACSGGCGKQQEVSVPKTDHRMIATEVYKQATCLEDGREDQCCAYCGLTRLNVAVSAYGHSYSSNIREDATCTAGDRIYRKCTRCGDIQLLWSGAAQPLGHSYGEVVTLEADCLNPQRSCRICTRCSAEDVVSTVGKPLGHDLSDTKITRDSTCSIPGLLELNCSRCDYSEEKIIPKLDHTPASRTTEADCVTPSYKETYCSVCNQSIKRETASAALGHKYTQETVDGTCQEPSIIKTVCSVCGDVKSSVSSGTTVKHKTELENLITPATCTEKGRGIYKCIWCDYRAYEYIPMLDHSLVERVTTVSCTTDGKIEVVCEVCSYVSSSVVTEEAPGHDLKTVNVVIQGNCLVTGVEHKKCERCGYDAGNIVIPAPGHNFQETTIAPTCTEQGMRGVFCANCKEQKGEILEYLPATGHNMTAIPAVAPGCTEVGYTEGEHCPACGMVTIEPKEIPATGHTEVKLPRQEPSCGVVGYTEGTGCSVCGAVIVAPDEIPALEHTIRTLSAVAPTCDKTGLKEGSACITCHKVFTEQEVIPALGHEFEVVLGKDATCTEPGLTIGEVCGVCGAVLDPQVEIPALGHNVIIDKGYAATCLQAGLTDGSHCSTCNTILQEPKTIPVQPHAWELSPDSSKIYICDGCGQEVSSKPSSVTINADSGIVLEPGETLDLTVVYSPKASYSPLKWTSSNQKVLTVDENGCVEAIGEGSATITVRTANSKRDTLKISVVDPTTPTDVQLDHSGTIILGVGEEIELYAELFPDTAESEIEWASKKPKIASVDEYGVVTALKKGSTVIRAMTYNGVYDTVNVTVVSATVPYSVVLDHSGTVTLEVGEELQLGAEILPGSADSELKWTSSKKAIAAVNEDGLVLARSEGTAVITVTTENRKKDTVKIKVVDPSMPSSVELNEEGTINLEVGEELELYATIYPDTAESELSWRSNRSKVATVDEDGLVTAVAAGSAVISVTTENGKVASVRVKVS